MTTPFVGTAALHQTELLSVAMERSVYSHNCGRTAYCGSVPNPDPELEPCGRLAWVFCHFAVHKLVAASLARKRLHTR